MNSEQFDIAIIIPCFNEALAIGNVINEFKNHLPEAAIHVFDNASLDKTEENAINAGAQVHRVNKRGKGNVVRAMFRDIDADYYILVDGDGTYSPETVTKMLHATIESKCDMTIGSRIDAYKDSESRAGHLFGNRLLTRAVNYLFDANFEDMLSGYRVMSRRFVKSVPLFTEGFEVETALSIHAIEVDAKYLEMPVQYRKRITGTESKLSTFKDGAKIIWAIFSMFKDYRPTTVFGIITLLLAVIGLIAGIPVIIEFLQTGLVPRFPTAIFASGVMIMSFITLVTGILLSSIARNRRIMKKLAFLSAK